VAPDPEAVRVGVAVWTAGRGRTRADRGSLHCCTVVAAPSPPPPLLGPQIISCVRNWTARIRLWYISPAPSEAGILYSTPCGPIFVQGIVWSPRGRIVWRTGTP